MKTNAGKAVEYNLFNFFFNSLNVNNIHEYKYNQFYLKFNIYILL